MSSATPRSTCVLAAEEVGDAGVLEVREVGLAHLLAHQHDHVIAVDVGLAGSAACPSRPRRWRSAARGGRRHGRSSRCDGPPPRASRRGPANSRMVVVPTSQAPMPKLSAVLSNRLAALLRPGSLGQRSVRILPSMVVHMWQIDPGLHRVDARCCNARCKASLTAPTVGGSSMAWFRVRARKAERPFVVAHLEVGELEPVGGRDAPPRARPRSIVAARDQLLQHRQRHAGVRAVEHAGRSAAAAASASSLLGRLLDHAVERAAASGSRACQLTGLPIWIARGQGLVRASIGSKLVEAARGRRGRADWRAAAWATHDARQRRGSARARASSGSRRPSADDVAEVAARDDHPVRHLPVELLHDLDARPSSGPRGAASSSSWPGRCPARRPAPARCAMQPSKSVSSASTSAPLASGWTSCAVEILPRGRSTTARMPAAAQ